MRLPAETHRYFLRHRLAAPPPIPLPHPRRIRSHVCRNRIRHGVTCPQLVRPGDKPLMCAICALLSTWLAILRPKTLHPRKEDGTLFSPYRCLDKWVHRTRQSEALPAASAYSLASQQGQSGLGEADSQGLTSDRRFKARNRHPTPHPASPCPTWRAPPKHGTIHL